MGIYIFIKTKKFHFDLSVYMYIIVANKSVAAWIDYDFSRL